MRTYEDIDSILCQKGDFQLEVVVGEDCSTDNTGAICQEYAARYPEQVVLLDNKQNMGIMRNFANTIKHCTGDMIAICAGDDYWCDEKKLQKQNQKNAVWKTNFCHLEQSKSKLP